MGPKKRLIVVGGVAAGASAAAKARRTSEALDVVLLEAGPYVSFANCGLPYYVGGEIEQRDRLFVTNPEVLATRFGIDVRTGTSVVGVSPEQRIVTAESQSGTTTQMEYDRLILATGTVAVKPPPISGLERGNIFTVRTVPDVDGIVNYLKSRKTRAGEPRVLVMGAGYIGLEMAEQMLRLNCRVTVVEKAPQVMLSLDPEMSHPLKEALEAAGVEVILNDLVARIVEDAGVSFAVTGSGRELPFDLGILSLGVRPNVELAREAGLALGTTGAIAVDERQRTSDAAIYAAGDNCEARHLVLKRPVNIPLAGPANKQGRIAGANAALDLLGAEERDPRRMSFRGVLGTAVVRVFDCYAAVTGLTERRARECGVPAEATYMFGSSHASYYPGAESILLKVLSHPQSGEILGAQAVGGKGTEKRVDVLATAITGGLHLEDLEQLDLSYAPPVGSAKDLAVMLGFAGANIRRGVMPSITPSELLEELRGDDPPFILDVRTLQEFAEGHLEGAWNIPLDELRERLDEVPQDRTLLLHCRSGHRSYVAQRILLNHGWSEVRNLQGGLRLLDLTRAALGEV